MPNLLSIPFKKTYPTNIKEAARNYIYSHGGAHPDEFKDDISLWQNLRKDGVGGVVHVDRINSALLSVGISMICRAPQLNITYKLSCPACVDLDQTTNRCETLVASSEALNRMLCRSNSTLHTLRHSRMQGCQLR